ncbi:MAG TPA: tetratricopeptide repeat protein, partial [Candidatus Kapabacteria bacterium]|nr:tetratricopeptide repeat protein [Candidatus Kapabacteria bacterium]
HALFHKALYDALLPEERDILHRQCFEILKTEWDRQTAVQDKSMPLASKLLTHAEKCGELEAAADAALGAAQSAWRNYSESEAMEMLAHVKRLMGNAVTGTKHSKALGTALLLEADIHHVRGRYDDALRYAAEAYTQFESAHDTLKMVSVLNRKADLLRSKGLYEDSEQTARNALALIENDKSRTIESRTHEAAALNIIGNVNTLRGKYAEGLEYYAKCLAIQESNNDLTGIVVSLNNMGIIHFFRGNYGEALELYKKSLAICEPLGDRVRLGQSFNNIGAAHSARGEYEEALKYHTKSLNVREAIGDRAGIGMSLGNIGNLHSTRGEYEEALQWHEKSLAIREAIGERSGVAASLTDIGLEYCKLGKFHEALDYSNKSLAVWEEIGDRGGSVESLQNIGIVYRMQGDLAKSRSALERAHATAAETGKKEYMYMTMYELGLLCEAEANQGDESRRSEKLKESLSLIEDAATTLREMNSKYAEQCETELERIKKIANA